MSIIPRIPSDHKADKALASFDTPMTKLHNLFIATPWLPSIHNAIAAYIFDSAVSQRHIDSKNLKTSMIDFDIGNDVSFIRTIVYISPVDANHFKMTYWLGAKSPEAIQAVINSDLKWDIRCVECPEDRQSCFALQQRFHSAATVILRSADKPVIIGSRCRPLGASGPDMDAEKRYGFMSRLPQFITYDHSAANPFQSEETTTE